jgi:predicted RNA-binding protein YlxR (DUF448 family)
MQAVQATHEADRPGHARPASSRAPERRCLVTRESLPVDRLVRFVVAPDGAVVPDIEGRLPGRGLWLCAARDIVNKACAGRAFAKAARQATIVEDGLADRVERQLARRCLDLIGLARRTGDAVAGFEKAAEFLRRRRPGLIFFACDGAEGARGRIAGAAPAAPVVELLSSAELGAVFGRDRTVNVVVAEGGLAARLKVDCARLAGFRPAGRAPERES